LKRVERESLIKSFLLFFLSMGLLAGGLFYLDYRAKIPQLRQTVFDHLQICSYSLDCRDTGFDIVPFSPRALHRLDENATDFFSDFTLPETNSTTYLYRLIYPKTHYEKRLRKIRRITLKRYGATLAAIALLSFLFAWYSLRPLRSAYRLLEEFVRDILHDFNTPLASIRLNASMLARRCPDAKEPARIDRNVQALIDLQSDMRRHLEAIEADEERIDLNALVQSRLEPIRTLHPDLQITVDIPPTTVTADQKHLGRILDNLLTNAAKYNRPGGSITIAYDSKTRTLRISDTGRGITHPDKALHRFYKEGRSGQGLGLHIVKKLCKKLRCEISLQSRREKGTTVTLNLENLVSRSRR
jgi:signal transduction histidine kinase